MTSTIIQMPQAGSVHGEYPGHGFYPTMTPSGKVSFSHLHYSPCRFVFYLCYSLFPSFPHSSDYHCQLFIVFSGNQRQTFRKWENNLSKKTLNFIFLQVNQQTRKRINVNPSTPPTNPKATISDLIHQKQHQPYSHQP